MKKIVFLNGLAKGEEIYAVLYVEQKSGFLSCMLNVFNAKKESEFCLVVTDGRGVSHYEYFADDTRIFKINKDFLLDGEVLAELFVDGELRLMGRSGGSCEKQAGTQEDYLCETKETEPMGKGLSGAQEDADILCFGEEASVGKEDDFTTQAKYYIDLIKKIQDRERKEAECDDSIFKPDYVLGKDNVLGDSTSVSEFVRANIDEGGIGDDGLNTEKQADKSQLDSNRSFQQEFANYSEKLATKNSPSNDEQGKVDLLDNRSGIGEAQEKADENKWEDVAKQNKFKDIPQNTHTFYFKIAPIFEFLFEVAEREVLLSKRFKSAEFRKLRVGSEIYVLGKLYDNASEGLGSLPSVVVLGRPALKYRFVHTLGQRSVFLPNIECDEFGFEMLFCSSSCGSACLPRS